MTLHVSFPGAGGGCLAIRVSDTACPGRIRVVTDMPTLARIDKYFSGHASVQGDCIVLAVVAPS